MHGSLEVATIMAFGLVIVYCAIKVIAKIFK